MEKPKYGYGWLLKWVLAAILLTVGLTMFFANELVFLTTGVILVLFSLLRVVPLLKSLDKEVLRTLNLVEVIFTVLLGALMIYIGINASKNEGKIDDIWQYVYRYSLVFVLMFRGIIFFYSTTFLGEKTEQPKFWFHLFIFGLGAAIIALNDFNSEWVAILLLVVSVIGSVYLGYDGLRGYRLYREFSHGLNKGKEKSKSKSKDKELDVPQTDAPTPEKKEEDRPFIN